MIREFAIEPEVMATWQHFRELWPNLGVSRGRLVAEYPPDWREKVCRLAYEASSAKAASIAARLKPPPGQGIAPCWIRTNRPFDKGKDWLSNAEKHQPPAEFNAIIARKNPRGLRRVLVAGEFNQDQPPWKVQLQCEIPRTAADLLGSVKLLLDHSEEIMLVDQNFDPLLHRFKDPLAAWLQSRDPARPWRRCELHLAHPMENGRPDKTVLANRQHYLRSTLPSLVPTGSVLTTFHWLRKPGGKRLHPRFIITERGGIHYDYGLDEGDSPGERTIVTLMDQDLWQTVRADYTDPSPSFDITPDCVVGIAGTA